MKRLSVIGTGYVGLVTGTGMADNGLNVICMDSDIGKIADLKKGIMPIHEAGLADLVQKNVQAGRLFFTSDMQEAVENADVVFIAVGTPPKEDGSADLKHVLQAAKDIAGVMNGYKVIINKSTVPVGTGQRVKAVIRDTLRDNGKESVSFDIVSNPEFLQEGIAVKTFMNPSRIVIGTESERAKEVMEEIYDTGHFRSVPKVFTNIETAEIIKYAANTFLATKIAFINQIALLCDAAGADVADVARAMGMDDRIGDKFLMPGPGYGGSCFPKDTSALVRIGQEYGAALSLVAAVVDANDRQKMLMVEKIKKRLGDIAGKTIAVLGLAFKPDTDDVRESPAVDIIKALYEQGAKIRVVDPMAAENAKGYALKDMDISYCEQAETAAAGADAVVLLTHWRQFVDLDLSALKEAMRGKWFFDFRNVYEKDKVERAGLMYESVGRTCTK